MPNEFVARNGIIALANSIVTGSVTATQGFTGSLFGTSSWANNATTSSYILNAASASFATSAASATSASIAANAVTASHALNAVTASRALNANTASYANFAITSSISDNAVTASRALNANTASFATQAANASSASFATSAASATTASYANFANTASSADNFNVRNTLTATTIVVQTISSSVSFITGSTKFGTIITNTHQFTGSVGVTGSITVIDGVTNNLTASWANRAISASIADNAVTASRALNANSASFVLNAVSASFATSAASATSASYILNAASASFAQTSSFLNTLNQSLTISGSVLLSYGNSYWIGNNADSRPRLRLHHNTTDAYLDYSSSLFLRNGDPTIMVTFTPGGNVGIGTTNPSLSGGSTNKMIEISGTTNPGIAFGSTNTKWFIYNSDSARSFALFDNNAATDRLVVSASGNVGIGTANPGTLLDVRIGGTPPSLSAGTVARFTSAGGSGFDAIIGIVGGNAGRSIIDFSDTDSASPGRLIYEHGNNSMQFWTNGSNERMRIDSGGNVGIGTTNPSYKLAVAGDVQLGTGQNRTIQYDSNGGNFRITPNAGGWATGYFFNGSSGTYRGGFGGFGNTNDFTYYWIGGDYNAATMYITSGSSGNVGIGTTSPAQKLDVVGAALIGPTSGKMFIGDVGHGTTYPALAHQDYATTTGYVLLVPNNGYVFLNKRNVASTYIGFRRDNTDLMVLDNNGNLGIGTTAPSAKLQVIGNAIIGQSSNNSTSTTLEVTAGGSGFNSIIDFGYYQTFDASIYQLGYYGVDGGQFKIKDSGTGIAFDRMVMSGTSITFPSSSIGIGTTSPVYRLQVNGTTHLGDDLDSTVYGITQITRVGNPSDTKFWLSFIRNGFTISGIAYVTGSNTLGIWNQASNNSGTPTMVWSSGNVGIGTTSPSIARLQIIAAGSGFVHEKSSNQQFYGTGFNGNNGYFTYYTDSNFIFGYGTSTGGVPSVSTLTLTTGGSVGIGITSPQAPLHVIAASNADNALIQEWSYTAGNADVYSLMLKQTVTSGVVRYNFSMVNNSTAYNDVLVLDRGNVGIGTTSPLVRLDVRGTAIITNQAGGNYDENLRLPEATSGYAALTLGGAIAASGATAAQWTFVKWPTTNAFSIQNNTNNLLWIQTNGNVGMGTTSPGARLVVVGQGSGQMLVGDAGFGSGNYTGISLNGTLSTSAYNFLSSPTDQILYINRPTGNSIRFREANSDQVAIDTGGNVGIGSTAPAQKLDVNGSAQYNLGNSGFIKLLSGATQRHGFIQSAFSNFLFSNNIYYDGGNWRYDQNGFGAQVQTETLSAGVITFNTAASGTAGNVVTLNERMRITNGGNVYVGGTSLASDAKFGVSNANAEGIEFSPNISSNVTRMLSYNRSTNAYITSRMVASTFEWQISGTDAMRLTSGGELWINYTTDQGAYYLQVNGDVYAGAYFQSSDMRLKNILNKYDSNSFGAIEYKWKDGRDNKVHWGYTAQDAIKFIPDAVNENKDGYYTIDYHQAHTYKIAMLEKEIAELKQKLNLS